MTREPDDAPGPTGEQLVPELRGARPPLDPIELEDVRTRAAQALFGSAEPHRLGRFVVLGPIARGGMGAVYSAYDPELDRRVALKVLHPEQRASAQGRERLLKEARALARLDHPNVVPVHDVTVVDEQIILVMELVTGQTLAEWERAASRSWREIVTIYVEAGRGLAAAHRLGLVHRDFKPANAIVGDDGRLRVLDFGLARLSTDGDDDGQAAGTPGFMAPEQLAGEPATAQSDQFSFCVALHRALHGVAPYAGSTAEELLAAIRAGRRTHATDGRRTPVWLRALVDRGLAAAPADRHPSLSALLDQLARERGWRRWRLAAVATLGLAAVATTAMVTRSTAPAVATCDAGTAEIEPVWNAAVRANLQRHLDGIDVPYARVVDEPVMAALDRYRADWSAAHRTACIANRGGLDSTSLIDRRAACLRLRRDALAGGITVLASLDANTITGAVDVAVGLPPIADCARNELLQAEEPLPPANDARLQIETIRARLADAEALERAGDSERALAQTEQLVSRAEQVGYRSVLLETLLAQGRMLLFEESYARAQTILQRAEDLALEGQLVRHAVHAGARKIYAEAMDGVDAARLSAVVREADLLERLSRELPGDHFARPLLLNNLGSVHMNRGDRDRARVAYEAARDELAGVADRAPELWNVDMNLAMVTSDAPAREELARSVWLRFRDALGEAHLSTIGALYSYGHFVADPARSLEPVRRACELYQTYHPRLVVVLADCRTYLAFLTGELDQDPTTIYAEVADLTRTSSDAETARRHRMAVGYVQLHEGAFGAAREELAAVLASIPPGDDYGLVKARAHAHLGVALAEAAAGRHRAAVPHFEEAIALFEQLARPREDMEQRQRLTASRAGRASSLRELGREPR